MSEGAAVTVRRIPAPKWRVASGRTPVPKRRRGVWLALWPGPGVTQETAQSNSHGVDLRRDVNAILKA